MDLTLLSLSIKVRVLPLSLSLVSRVSTVTAAGGTEWSLKLI